jgi:hypothetical protein
MERIKQQNNRPAHFILKVRDEWLSMKYDPSTGIFIDADLPTDAAAPIFYGDDWEYKNRVHKGYIIV